MADQIYTVESANALLPHLAPTLVELREKFEAASEIQASLARIAATNGHSQSPDDEKRTLARVAELLERIQEWGLQLRDVATGLVDFPAEVNGRPAYLCWRLGEPDVAHWHSPDDGFRGRRPLGSSEP
jgi:hypothetical protein